MHRSLARGFSLVEVTIAVAIIGVLVVAMGTLMSRIPVAGREVRDQDLAMRIARNEIEMLRAAGYAALPASGIVTNPLLGLLASSSASVTTADFNEKTKRVDVSVSWIGTELVARSITLTTLVTENSTLK